MKYFPKKIYDNYILFYTGKIYNIKRKIFMKTSRRSKTAPYLSVTLTLDLKKQKTFNIHRLIALNFIPNDDPVNKPVVDHGNRNPIDNRICNLKWTDQKENCRNRTQKGYCKTFLNREKRFCVVYRISKTNNKIKSKSFKTEAEADKYIQDNYPFPLTLE